MACVTIPLLLLLFLRLSLIKLVVVVDHLHTFTVQETELIFHCIFKRFTLKYSAEMKRYGLHSIDHFYNTNHAKFIENTRFKVGGYM
jgi:acetate kinase